MKPVKEECSNNMCKRAYKRIFEYFDKWVHPKGIKEGSRKYILAPYFESHKCNVIAQLYACVIKHSQHLSPKEILNVIMAIL